ncbi:MAG: hypothetical protein V4731_10375 [Pseudomonadota bacterium]
MTQKKHSGRSTLKTWRLMMLARKSAVDLEDELARAREEASALNDRLDALTQWQQDKHRYQLFRPGLSAFVYGLRKSQSEGEPAHYLCPHCYERSCKSMLGMQIKKNCYTVFKCFSCGFQVTTGYAGTVTANYVENEHHAVDGHGPLKVPHGNFTPPEGRAGTGSSLSLRAE